MAGIDKSVSNTGSDAIKNATLSVSYRKADALSNRAINLARAYITPPTPSVYHIWYEYAGGSNREVVEKIDEIIKSRGVIDAFDLDTIHEEVLSKELRRRIQLEEFSDSLEAELSGMLRATAKHMNMSVQYEKELSNKSNRIQNADLALFTRAISAIILDSRAMRAETAKLSGCLRQLRSQNRFLRAELRESRKKELTDPLTGVKNRRGFNISIQKEIEKSYEETVPLSLILVDIDNFKKINDTFGHQIGDEVLKYVANLIKSRSAERGSTCRIGGEEFAVILPGMAMRTAYEIAESIRQSIEQSRLMVTESGEWLGVQTASFGIAELTEKDDAARLISRADANLYAAKRAGRNQVVPNVK